MTDVLDSPLGAVPLAPLSKADSLRRGALPRRVWLWLRGYRWRQVLVIDKAHFGYATADASGWSAEIVADETHTEHQWLRPGP